MSLELPSEVTEFVNNLNRTKAGETVSAKFIERSGRVCKVTRMGAFTWFLQLDTNAPVPKKNPVLLATDQVDSPHSYESIRVVMEDGPKFLLTLVNGPVTTIPAGWQVIWTSS